MKLKFIVSGKIQDGTVMIGKTGQMRFKMKMAEAYGFKVGDKWLVATDEDETPTKHIYLLKSNDNTGFQMGFQNKSWFIAAKTLVNELNLKTPMYLKWQEFNNDGYSGFKLTIPNN